MAPSSLECRQEVGRLWRLRLATFRKCKPSSTLQAAGAVTRTERRTPSAGPKNCSQRHGPTEHTHASRRSGSTPRTIPYFGPKLATSLAQVWTEAGGSVEEHILPPYGAEGHSIADDRRGWDMWGPSLQSFLTRTRENAGSGIKMAADPQPPPASSMIETSTLQPPAE